MIQKKTPIVTVEGAAITKNKKGMAGLEFNKEHAHWFLFRHEGDYSP
jgi:hypothetical protein